MCDEKVREYFAAGAWWVGVLLNQTLVAGRASGNGIERDPILIEKGQRELDARLVQGMQLIFEHGKRHLLATMTM